MADGENGDVLPNLNAEAAAMAITALCAALQTAVEFSIFPDRVKVDDKSAAARLEYVNKQIVRDVKNLFAENMSAVNERDGVAAALKLIDANDAAIRKHI